MTKRNLLRILEREREAFAAERARLIDQLFNLAGKPWTLPPRDPGDTQPDEPDPNEGLVADPQQLA